MKFYRCDICGEEFDGNNGMLNGFYSKEMGDVRFAVSPEYPGFNKRQEIFKLRKTLKIYQLDTTHRAGADREYDVHKDVCPNCIKKLEEL